MKKICETLSATALFKGLNHDIFHAYCGQTNIRLFWRGEILFHEGDLCTGIGMIVEGQIALQKYSGSGDFATIELLGAGDYFGEHLMFGDQHTYPVTLEAVSNGKVIFVSKDVLSALLRQHERIVHNFLTILSNRIESQNRRISLLSQKSLRQKIAYYLVELLNDQIQQEGESPRQVKGTVSTQAVKLPVPKEVVARLLAMPRPSLSRELISMESDGLIRMNGRVIWLVDLERLEQNVLEGFRD